MSPKCRRYIRTRTDASVPSVTLTTPTPLIYIHIYQQFGDTLGLCRTGGRAEPPIAPERPPDQTYPHACGQHPRRALVDRRTARGLVAHPAAARRGMPRRAATFRQNRPWHHNAHRSRPSAPRRTENLPRMSRPTSLRHLARQHRAVRPPARRHRWADQHPARSAAGRAGARPHPLVDLVTMAGRLCNKANNGVLNSATIARANSSLIAPVHKTRDYASPSRDLAIPNPAPPKPLVRDSICAGRTPRRPAITADWRLASAPVRPLVPPRVSNCIIWARAHKT